MRTLLRLLLLAFGLHGALHAQTPKPGPDWDRLKALPAHIHMHVSSASGGKTCYLIAVDDQSLTCGRKDGSPKGARAFPRNTIASVKLTRYGMSTLGGLGIGLAAGGIIGVAVFRPHPQDFLGNLGESIGRGFTIAVGGVAGPIVGGTTDMFRGPTIYQR